MLKELFESIQKAAVEGAKPRPIMLSLPNGVTRVYSQGDGAPEDLIAIPDRSHCLLSVDQVGPFVGYHIERREANPVVWYSDKGIIVVLDDAMNSRRNDQAILWFRPTEEFAFVQELADDVEFRTAKEMIRLLRQNLFDAFGSSDKRDRLIKTLRVTRFEDDEQAKLGTARRSVSTGSEGDEFPDMVVLSLRPLDDPALITTYDVKCHFEVDPDTKSFALIPIKSELKKATDAALLELHELLEDSVKCPLFRGAP